MRRPPEVPYWLAVVVVCAAAGVGYWTGSAP